MLGDLFLRLGGVYSSFGFAARLFAIIIGFHVDNGAVFKLDGDNLCHNAVEICLDRDYNNRLGFGAIAGWG